MYVITGQVARDQAGPAVVLSFLIAAVTSLLSGKVLLENTNDLISFNPELFLGEIQHHSLFQLNA